MTQPATESLTPEERHLLQRERETSRRKQLAVETAFLLALVRRRARVVRESRSSGLLLEASLRMALVDEIASWRGIARARSRERTIREMHVFPEYERIVRGMGQRPAAGYRVNATSAAAANAEARRVVLEIEDDDTPSGRRAAVRAQGGLGRIATTETTDAWEEERRAIAATLPPGTEEVWDATLDARVCERCLDLDGETTDPGEDFAGGLRPPAHPNCRCTTHFRPMRH